MEPLLALLVGFGGARLAGAVGINALNGWQPALRVGVALMFLLTTFAHFRPQLRADLVARVPPALPNPGMLVTLTGILELAGAVGVLIPATAPIAAACLIALMIVMFPANVSAARRRVAQGDPIGRRTALQLVSIAAAALIIP